MAAPTRFNDGRYSKWGSLAERQEPLLAELTRLAESRPKSRFNLDDWVKTPKGWKRVSDMYHSQAGWVYRFHMDGYSQSYNEAELAPLPDTWFTPDSEVKLPHGAFAKVVGYTGNLVIVELRPKQMVGIPESELRQHNPIAEYALRMMYRAFACGDYLLEEDAKRVARKALPGYSHK